MKRIQTITPWVPKFRWVNSVEAVADLINLPHEDYPARVQDTIEQITNLQEIYKSFPVPISKYLLWSIHADIFSEAPWAGDWRKVDVIVGNFRPPSWYFIEEDMKHFIADSQYITDIGNLYTWYHNFETIHPFRDGNGRVGGIIVAVISHLIDPKNGWLAPCQ